MNWLARLKDLGNAPDHDPAKPAETPFAGFAGTHPRPFGNSAPTNDALAARLALFTERGLRLEDAEELADRLERRDLERDDRRLCIECSHLSGAAGGWRCGQWRKRQYLTPDIPGDLVTAILHRCSGFGCATVPSIKSNNTFNKLGEPGDGGILSIPHPLPIPPNVQEAQYGIQD